MQKNRAVVATIVVLLTGISLFTGCARTVKTGGKSLFPSGNGLNHDPATILNTEETSKESTGVPEQVVERDIRESLAYYEINMSSFTLTHSVDEASHSDNVQAEVMTRGTYCQDCYYWTCYYQYSKTDDTWSAYGKPSWGYDRTVFIPESYVGDWEGYFSNGGGSYTGYITDVDFDNNTITGCFTVQQSEVGERTRTLWAEGTFPLNKTITQGELSFEFSQDGCRCYFVLDYCGLHGVVASRQYN